VAEGSETRLPASFENRSAIRGRIDTAARKAGKIRGETGE